MVRATTTKKKFEIDDDRSRLKKLAVSRGIISQTPAKPSSTLSFSKTVLKHGSQDIMKKSQRKNRYLFSFPGLLGPITGGKIGELIDLGTKKPILYMDFPEGRVKLFGTIVYPQNKYLTMQFSKGGKNVVCEDNFDNMVVFSDAWWIGTKDENPEEVQLEYPKNLTKGKHTDADFKGGAGAGATCEQKPGSSKPRKEIVETETPSTDAEEDFEDFSLLDEKDKDLMEVKSVRPKRNSAIKANYTEPSLDFIETETPSTDAEDDSEDVILLDEKNKDLMEVKAVRPKRSAAKKSKFTEPSSEGNSTESDSDSSIARKRVKQKHDVEAEVASLVVHTMDNVNIVTKTNLPRQKPQPSISLKSKEISFSKGGPLVQATISNLFSKAKAKDTAGKDKVTQIEKRKPVIASKTRKKQSQAEDEDIEEFSTESEDIEDSDEDWAA